MVADDGVGGATVEGGTGLRGLIDRLAVLDGRLAVTSPPGKGTRLEAHIPIIAGGEASRVKRLALLAAAARARGLRQGRPRSASPTCSSAARRRPTPATRPTSRRAACGSPNARIVFITHGQASDPFWTIVKRGLGDAQRQSGTAVSYRAPDRFSIERMRRYIEEAIVDQPDGMVVSLPDFDALAPSIRARGRGRDPGRHDQLRQRQVQVARRARAHRPAGVQGGRRERRADGPRGRAAGAVREPGVGQQRARRALPRLRRRAARASAAGRASSRSRSRTRRRRRRRWRPRSWSGPSTASSRSARAAPSPRWTPSARAAGGARQARDVRPLARGADRGPRRRHAVRRRPAAVPAGLPAGDAARRAGALPGLPRPRRADPDRAAVRDRARTRPT